MLGFDLVRAFAAISVIWVHAGRSAEWHALHLSDLGRWGTAFLNMLAAFFLVVTLQKFLVRTPGVAGASSFLGHRLARIGLPFVIWSLVYVAARGLNYVLFGKATDLQLSPTLLVHGTTYHLWFLPYLMLISTLAMPAVYWAIGSKVRERVLSAITAAIAMYILFAPVPTWLPSDQHSLTVIFGTVYMRSPAFLFGLTFGLLYVSKFKLQVPLALGLAGGVMAVLAAGCSTISTTEAVDMVWYRIAAVGAFVVALMPWRGMLATAGAKLGSLGFGVYLCHLLFVEFGHAVAHAMKLHPSISQDVMVFVFAVIASFTFAALMRKTAWLRWLIP